MERLLAENTAHGSDLEEAIRTLQVQQDRRVVEDESSNHHHASPSLLISPSRLHPLGATNRVPSREAAPNRLGEDAIVSVLYRYVHPSGVVRELFPNMFHQGRLQNCTVLRQEMKKIHRRDQMAVVFTCPHVFGSQELYCVRRWLTVHREGREDKLFDVSEDDDAEEEAAHSSNSSTAMLSSFVLPAFSRRGILPANSVNNNAGGSTRLLLDESRTERGERKRKAEALDDVVLDKQNQEDDPQNKKRAAVLSVTGNSFPLPSVKSERNVHTSLLASFHSLWSELEDSEMQEEIFRQRIYQEIKIVGKSRSIKKKEST